MAKPRRTNHALVWMAVTKAKCECGELLEIPLDECKDRAASTIRDWLMDAHSEHIKTA